MKLLTLFKQFRKDESGAVTVDWVVLTAAIVGLGIAVIVSVSSGVNDLGGDIATSLEGGQVRSLDDLATASAPPSSTTGTEAPTNEEAPPEG